MMMTQTREVSGLVGRAFKLASPSGTILGTVTIPYRWAAMLWESGAVQFSYTEWPLFLSFRGPEAVDLQIATLRQSRHDQEAIELHGISLEQFEKRPGCSFSPSAAYLRSLIAE